VVYSAGFWITFGISSWYPLLGDSGLYAIKYEPYFPLKMFCVLLVPGIAAVALSDRLAIMLGEYFANRRPSGITEQ
jgi:hypothetical protein